MPTSLRKPFGVSTKARLACSAPEFRDIPGVSSIAKQVPDQSSPTDQFAQLDPVFRAGNAGVTRPKPISSPDPSFGDEARLAKYQGTVTLKMVVDRTGSTRDIHIVSPLGCGFDRRAVEKVATWKFVPATKDSEPVDVELAVEVDFHLY
jgi:TonB family protein